MLAFILRRFCVALPTLFVVITCSFFLMRLAPGGPFDLDRPLDPAIMENLRRVYQLDQPLYMQYWNYLVSLAHGDLGPSYILRDFSVSDLFARGLPISMTLGAWALLLALILGSVLGLTGAFHQNSWVDRLVMGFASFGLTLPSFVIAPLLQLCFGLALRWLPLSGWGGAWYEDGWRHMILPIATLALAQTAIIARLLRAATIEILNAHPMRTLRANGLSKGTRYLHAFRGACLPVVSYLGPAAASLLTGSVVVETIFGIPGVGRYFVEGALNRDYTLVMGTVVLVAVLVIFFNLIVDLLYGLVDPRVRYE